MAATSATDGPETTPDTVPGPGGVGAGGTGGGNSVAAGARSVSAGGS